MKFPLRFAAMSAAALVAGCATTTAPPAPSQPATASTAPTAMVLEQLKPYGDVVE